MKKYYVDWLRLKPGDELIVPKSGWDIIQHHALYIGYDHQGIHWIIHNNVQTGVSLITVDDFFTQVHKVNKIMRFTGTNTERKALVQRALIRIGKPYDLINYNCEHFISEVKTGSASSPQVKSGLAFAGILLLAAIFIE
ncbi:MAG: lecithin retinol acyltransferase family protein [Sphingobacteriales bacterium]|nr:lecithin retinol acyltransferase family protein [Sphingobacteriales bacterium]